MSGALLGLVFGCGLACIWWSFWPRPEPSTRSRRRVALAGLRDDLVLSGVRGLSVASLLVLSLACGLVVLVLGAALTRTPAIAAAFAVMAGIAPITLVRARARKRRAGLRDLWPDVVDHVSSAVRAGLSLPEALVQLADRGPEDLRDSFAAFAYDYRASGHFSDSLDRLKERLADPVADRLVEALRIAREVGGTDLGRLLRALSSFLREDARSRAELEARQSWTVNAARLAMAAPWIVLLLMATRGAALEAYREPAGVLVLAVGAAACFVAYRIMLRIGRLPEEERVLR